MGYVEQDDIYRLVFEDRPGLEVRATSLSMKDLLALISLSDLTNRRIAPEDAPRVEKLFALFATALVSWNVERKDGTPVAASLAGLLSQKQPFVMAIIKAWSEAVAGVAAPLPQTSSGGGQSLEASMSMEPLSPSLTS